MTSCKERVLPSSGDSSGPEDPSLYKGKSYAQLMGLFKSYRNGYGTHYWVESRFQGELNPGAPEPD